MNPSIHSTFSRAAGLLCRACLAALLITGVSAIASPGAHGPNGEHLDASGQAGNTGGVVPRIEARSEAFELVGRLQGGELSILINRFETNEPVLNATVEVETGGLKASAKFHADMGDYAVDDAAMLKALAVPGDHALVISIMANSESDLLDGTLNTPDTAANQHGHAHSVPVAAWVALALVFLAAIGGFIYRKRKVAMSSRVGGVQ